MKIILDIWEFCAYIMHTVRFANGRSTPLAGATPPERFTMPPSKEQIARFEDLWARALEAGIRAGSAAEPEPMVVVQHSSPMDDSSPVVRAWHVPEGLCGFAWVRFPANTAFGRWAKKTGRAGSSYSGGLTYWVHDHNQSVVRKEAHARAFAIVLEEAGIRSSVESRLD